MAKLPVGCEESRDKPGAPRSRPPSSVPFSGAPIAVSFQQGRTDYMERKMFWIIFTLLSLLGYFLPLGWAIAEMFVALFASWWIVYRSGWI
jgi:hypothetical protein